MKSRVLLIVSLIIKTSILTQGIFAQDMSDIKRVNPISINGNVSLGSFFYNSQGRTSPLPAYGYSLAANATLSLYGVEFPFFISYNDQENSFQHPFNQFGVSPTYKWVKIHLGHRTYNYSQFILAGRNMYSVGVDLTPGMFRFSAVKGRLNNSSEEEGQGFVYDRFKRTGYAYKIGLGTDKNFVDLILFKAKDDLTSLPGMQDSLRRFVEANDNLATGITSNFSFFKDHVTLHIDGALSAVTENIRDQPIALPDIPLVDKFSNLLQANLTTHVNYAGEAMLNYKSNNMNLGLKYRRVTPQFKSLGVNYLLTDLENYTINPSFSLFEQKLRLGGSYGIENNNLDKRLSEKSNRMIGSLNVDFEPNQKFGVNVNYANYSIYQQVFKDELSNDSILVNQINHNASITPHYTITKENSIQNILLNLNYQILYTSEFVNNQLYNILLSYIFTIPKSGFNLRVSANYFDFQSMSVSNTRGGMSLGASKKLGKTGLSVNGSFTYTVITVQNDQGYNYRIAAAINYLLKKRHSISFTLFQVKNDIATSNFSELRGQLRYNYRF